MARLEGARIVEVRAVARGTIDAVLALPGIAQRGEMMLHNHPSGVLEPSMADLSVASRLHDGGIGFGIVNNDASDLYVVVEVPRGSEPDAIDPFEVIDLLGARGPVAGVLGQYEDRPSQRDMAAHISDAYNAGGTVLLEAGTGVGKSFAYLVPALVWARVNRERTVVSTNTINLQEQLVGKDLPLLAKALGGEQWQPKFALLKGWRNYLCLSRLQTALAGQRSLLEPDQQQELTNLAAWASHSADGSLSDLTEAPSSDVWDEISAEPDLCTRIKCPNYEACFLFRARRRAAEADVVVVNHHLLASDLAVRQAQENWEDAAVLPPYRRLILDEAHHLEDVAANHLGVQVTSRGIRRLLGRLERNGKGLLPTLSHELALTDDLLSRASADLLRERLLPALRDARRDSDMVIERLHRRLEGVTGGVLRVDEEFSHDPIWSDGLSRDLDAALGAFKSLRDHLETIADRLQGDEASDRRAQLLMECRAVIRRLEAVADGLNQTLRPAGGGPPSVRWIERTGSKGQQLGLASVPLDLAPILRELIFDRVKTVALTSATLAAGGDFDFLESRVGLSGEGSPVTVREILPSPFDFGRQCLFGIPDDIPDPREDDLGHADAICAVVRDLAHAADGGLFVLFTSHAALRRCAAELRSTMGQRWPLLVQGEGTRDALLRRFREAGNAVLLGTDSFWEGVDVPGRALRGLVLTKLPFKVPSEPITAARLERLEEQGQNGFAHYLLPHAALKLKQGFGRLIRTATDVGVVLLLDPRVLRKSYGRLVLEGLPPAEQVTGTWARVRTRCEDFFARHGIGAEV
ncbi:MAG TPA: helicase C-terminal domain-containing protein [Gemmatimonadales bacterium]|nr:helicase C-terminal domain-containing protein [Gemmatimonadales bacterium]